MGFGISPAQVRTIIEEEVASQTDKLAGETPGDSSVLANWQSGTGTSTEAGADLVTIGSAGDRKKVHSFTVGIGALTPAAQINIKLFRLVNGVDTKVYDQPFIVGTDPDGIWVINGTLEIDGLLRCEVQSNQAGDNGLAVTYNYNTEDM